MRLVIKVILYEEQRMVQIDVFIRSEDGIRNYDVTGVQTCALPILKLQEIRAGNAIS